MVSGNIYAFMIGLFFTISSILVPFSQASATSLPMEMAMESSIDMDASNHSHSDIIMDEECVDHCADSSLMDQNCTSNCFQAGSTSVAVISGNFHLSAFKINTQNVFSDQKVRLSQTLLDLPPPRL